VNGADENDTKNNYEIPRAEKNGSGTVVFVNSRKSGSVLGGVFTTEKCNYFCERRYFVIDKSLLMSEPVYKDTLKIVKKQPQKLNCT